jgi:hypothetical protein
MPGVYVTKRSYHNITSEHRDPDDGGNKLLRNVGQYPSDYAASPHETATFKRLTKVTFNQASRTRKDWLEP